VVITVDVEAATQSQTSPQHQQRHSEAMMIQQAEHVNQQHSDQAHHAFLLGCVVATFCVWVFYMFLYAARNTM